MKTYRKPGTTDWKQALPMLRLHGERIKQGDQLDVTSPNMFAGSILDLEPNTAYEARLVLRDPDGVSGQATKTVTVRTRPEPMPAPGCSRGGAVLSARLSRSRQPAAAGVVGLTHEAVS